MRIVFILAIGLTAAWIGSKPVSAEKIDLTPEQLRKTATHIIVGKIRRVYTTQETKGNWKVTRYVAEVRVSQLEKGKGIDVGKTLFVRYWTQRWAGRGVPPPSTHGHRDLPGPSDERRIYLARDAYNGFGEGDRDGGFDVIGANGFERSVKK